MGVHSINSDWASLVCVMQESIIVQVYSANRAAQKMGNLAEDYVSLIVGKGLPSSAMKKESPRQCAGNLFV